ncbi:hypothetical protein [Pedobacter frigiditerrae]|uniref:hypothetical protein n=1 Tax=Pedobacter frigiditerrae TaxID=2530452 RepID=UPI00293129C8|nr:hypothetical protein [Pedobacter frigiditerrae]
MRKHLLIIVLFFSLGFVKAQIPIIKSNVADEFKNSSLVYKTFHNKYDLLIAFRTFSGWRIGNTNYIEILAYKNNSWKKILLTYPDNNPSKQTIKKSSLNKIKAKKLMGELESQNFWTLSNDSINMQYLEPQTVVANYAKNDTVFIVANFPHNRISVLDGSSYYFEILQGNNLRSYHTADPEEIAKHFPEVKSRIKFIKSKAAFENALK